MLLAASFFNINLLSWPLSHINNLHNVLTYTRFTVFTSLHSCVKNWAALAGVAADVVCDGILASQSVELGFLEPQWKWTARDKSRSFVSDSATPNLATLIFGINLFQHQPFSTNTFSQQQFTPAYFNIHMLQMMLIGISENCYNTVAHLGFWHQHFANINLLALAFADINSLQCQVLAY